MSETGGFRSINRTTGVGKIGSGGPVDSKVLLSKMVKSNAYQGRGIDNYYGQDALLDMTAERQVENMDDYENILMTQPELELPIQILISCIISPKSATTITLKHSTKKNPLPVELNNKLLQSMKDCIEDVYKIKTTLPERLRKALFTVGADVTLILGEAVIDDVINGRVEQIRTIATESLRVKEMTKLVEDCTRPVGIFSLGNQRSDVMTTESVLNSLVSKQNQTNVAPMICTDWSTLNGFKAPVLCDNPKLVSLGMAVESMLDQKQQFLNSVTGKSRNLEALERLYHNVAGGNEPAMILPSNDSASRKSLDRPVRRTIPTESCVPVFQPGNPKRHLGYLLMVDEFGSFVSRDTRRDYWKNIGDVMGGNREVVSSILQRSADSMKTDGVNDMVIAQAAAHSFRELAIRDTESRLLSGKIGNNDLFFNLMFERALSGRQTRVLYVPADMVTYWAYKYNSNGTGRSLLEDNKFLASMRTLLIVANTETQIRNSIDYTKLSLTFDPNDPNKTRTKETIIDQYIRHRLRSTPWATTHPRRVVEQLQMAGVSIDIDGGDNYPGTKVSIDRQDIQQRDVNTDLIDSSFKRIMMGFGIAPEIVDLSTAIEFSSKMVTSNELSLKRVMLLQDITNHHLQRDSVKTVIADPIQSAEFEKIVKEWINGLPENEYSAQQKAELNVGRIIDIFLSSYEINLPRPESGLDVDMAEFDKHMEAVEKVLDRIINDDAVGGIDDGKLSESYGRLRAMILQQKALEWMADHDFMPDLIEAVRYERDTGIPELIKEMVSHVSDVNGIIKMLIPRLEAMNVVDSEQITTILNELNEQRQKTAEGDGVTSNESSTEESPGDSEGFDGMGGDNPVESEELDESDNPEANPDDKDDTNKPTDDDDADFSL